MTQNKITPNESKSMGEVFLSMVKRSLEPAPSIKLADWPNFNRFTGGFRAHEFSILCGSTGIGKTTFLANLSAQLMKSGAKQFIMSVETGAEDYVARLTSVFAEYDLNAVDEVPKDKLVQIVQDHQAMILGTGARFALYEDRVSVEQIKADIEHAHANHGTQIIFIDNLNYLLDVKRSQDMVLEMDRVLHSLIVFVKRVPVHIVMVMHSKKPENGSGEDFGRVENEFQIKGSSTAVQEAQNVFLLNRPKREDIDSEKRLFSDRELKFSKMRRRGKFVGIEIVFGNSETKYREKTIVDVFGSARADSQKNNDDPNRGSTETRSGRRLGDRYIDRRVPDA